MSKQDKLPTVKGGKINWGEEDDKHYLAALAYLSLLYQEATATNLARLLKKATLSKHRVNDVLRASGLKPAKLSDPGIAKDAAKLNHGLAFEPILLVRNANLLVRNANCGLIVADGYHRLSLLSYYDPFETLQAKIV